MANLLELHQKSYPDMPIDEFARRVHAKSYSDMPFDEFAKKAGLLAGEVYESPGNMGFGKRGPSLSRREEGFLAGWESQRPVDQDVVLGAIAPDDLQPERMPRGMPGDGGDPLMQRGMREIPNDQFRDGVKGETFTIKAPTAPARPFLKGAEDMASFGFADELSGDPEFARGEMEALELRAPGQMLAGQLAGALTLPGGPAKLAATRLGNALRLGGISAAQAGLYGVGSGEGLEDRISSGLASAGVGAALGGALGATVRGAGKKGQFPPSPPKGMIASRAAKAAEVEGIPLSRGAASERASLQAMYRALEQVPFVGGIVSRSLANTRKGLEDALGRVVSKRGSGDFESGATAAQRGLEKGAEAMEAKGSALYRKAEALIDPAKTVRLSALERVTQRLLKEAENAGQDGSAIVDTLGTALQKSAQAGFNFEGVKRLRSIMGEEMASATRRMRTQDLKAVYKALSEDLETAAAASGNAALSAVKRANRYHRARMGRFEATAPIREAARQGQALTRLSQMAQEGTSSLDTKLLGQTLRSMPKRERDEAISGLLGRVGYDDKMQEVSAAKFATGWGKFSNEAKVQLFTAAERRALENVAIVARQVEKTGAFANRSNTGRLVLAGGLITDPFVAAGTALKAVGISLPLIALLSRPATSKNFAKWARNKAYAGKNKLATAKARAAVQKSSQVFSADIAQRFGLAKDIEATLAEALAGGARQSYADDEQDR